MVKGSAPDSYPPADESGFGVWESLNIEQGLTNSELKSEYLLRKSKIVNRCSEISS